jgi:HPt (histidine-containing phosphotransfer) domain-containing protein
MDFCSTVGPKLSRKLFDTFIISLNTKVPALNSLYKQGHFYEIENTVHQLKSNCRYFGFYEFADICETIEHQMISDPKNMAQGQIDILLDMTGGILETLKWAQGELSQLQQRSA